MQFEFDAAKSETNKIKHGIDFVEAQSIWDDPDALELSAQLEDEPRFLVIGMIGSKIWTAVITYRGEKTRIISVRRARKKEIAAYESA